MKTITKKTKTEFVKMMLSTNQKWALRCLEVIYSQQDPIEQCSNYTILKNGIGFSGADSQILSSFARQYKQRGTLSEKQMVVLQKRAPHYWEQILGVIPESKLVRAMLDNNYINQEQFNQYEKELFLQML